MGIKLNRGCVKLTLPNGCVVDILTSVLDEIAKWLQTTPDAPESGGYIVGYEHKDTGNVVLEKVSVPEKKESKPVKLWFASMAGKYKALMEQVWEEQELV